MRSARYSLTTFLPVPGMKYWEREAVLVLSEEKYSIWSRKRT